MRESAKKATLESARAFGFGGNEWAVERPLGGFTSAASMSDQPNIRGYVFRQRPSTAQYARAARSDVDTPVLKDEWYLIVTSGTTQPRDKITSVTVSGYMFTVATAEPWYEYTRCSLERGR